MSFEVTFTRQVDGVVLANLQMEAVPRVGDFVSIGEETATMETRSVAAVHWQVYKTPNSAMAAQFADVLVELSEIRKQSGRS